jgi:UDP-GlcNAc:undecaprenyl-phosphate/decaprenyl-phosphate GlcNAc-1-phosphate transferase
VKLVAQIVLATVMAALGLRLHLTDYAAVNFALTLLWVVGVANAFNLLDNMDGLAASIAFIAAGFRLAFFLVDGDVQGALAAATFMGAVAGFLAYNFPPASIFMGDAGSLFIGIFVAGLSLGDRDAYSRNIASVLLIPVLTVLVPIFDTGFVAINRTLAGRPVSQGGRDHLSHRLVALGLTERATLAVLSFVAAVAGGVAYLSYRLGLSYGVVLIAFLLIAIGVFAVYLSQAHVYPDGSGTPAQLWTRLRDYATKYARGQQVATVCLDACLIVLSYYTAFLLRYEDQVRQHASLILVSLPVVMICQLSVLALLKVHQLIWRYVGLDDILRVIVACVLAVLASVTVLVAIDGFRGYSLAVFVLDWLLLVSSISGSRIFFRLLVRWLRPGAVVSNPVLIYGAGDGGVLVLRELINNPSLGRTPVGFVDDDPGKQGLQIQGIPVVGTSEHLDSILQEWDVAELLVSTDQIPHERLAAILRRCSALGVGVVTASLHLE